MLILIKSLKDSIMKTLQKLKLPRAVLTTEELRQLKGGNDITNSNSVGGCTCTYLNKTRTVTNTNSISGCQCTCTY